MSTERDHRIKIRFPWQGASVSGAQPDSPADAAGIWVRVAVPWAGANWGAVLLPRVGSEVAVEFLHHDIDRPIVIGALYNGQERPPFAAGADSDFTYWLRRQRTLPLSAISPGLELVFSSACETDDPAKKSVAPEGTELEDVKSRMNWIASTANKFHLLMQTDKTYMENQLRTIAEWVSLPAT